jgi:hypothetical protein
MSSNTERSQALKLWLLEARYTDIRSRSGAATRAALGRCTFVLLGED